MNTTAFYDVVRPALFGSKMKPSQVEGIEALLGAACELDDERQVAYLLATAYHETSKTMQPAREPGQGAGKDYGRKLTRMRRPYDAPDHLYYGRGLMPLRWYENYERLGRAIGANLLHEPEQAMELGTACRVLVTGMSRGLFTGVRLDTYFNHEREDWQQARKIINDLDCADRIAGYARVFYKGLTE